MKLNVDCVRDILIAVEACDFGCRLTLPALQERLPQYSAQDLHYVCLKLSEGGLLKINAVPVPAQPMSGIKSIDDLTYEGHQFLANIRKDNIWVHVKNIAAKLGTGSLTSFTQIAANVATVLIKQEFGIT